MSTRTKWLVGLFTLIAIIAISLPVYFYYIDFGNLKRSSIPSEWGTFGDFIGGILNPIISLLTLIVTICVALYVAKIEKRNHEETVHSPVKPYLTIKSGQFFTSYRNLAGSYWDEYYFVYKPPQSPGSPLDHLSNEFYLRVSNKGLGAATEVSVTYEIDLIRLKNLLAIDNSGFKVSLSEIKQVDKDQGNFIVINSDSNSGQYLQRIRVLAKNTRWVGLVTAGKKKKIPFSDEIISAFKIYEEKRRTNVPLDDFPPTRVTFEYKNIHGFKIKDQFDIGMFHLRDYPNFSLYRLLQIKIN